MDWASNLGGIIAALAAIVGLSLAFRKRKRSSSKNVEQLFHHLQEMGVKASLLEKGGEEGKVGVRRSWGQRAEGVIKIEGRNIDYINVISVASQYGVNYFLDFLVSSPSWQDKKKSKKTRMIKRRTSATKGKVVNIEWKGDDYLSRELNYDYRLQDKLLQAELDKLKSGIWIFPEPKYEYTRVRINYLLPSPDLLEAVDIIAGHIKSG